MIIMMEYKLADRHSTVAVIKNMNNLRKTTTRQKERLGMAETSESPLPGTLLFQSKTSLSLPKSSITWGSSIKINEPMRAVHIQTTTDTNPIWSINSTTPTTKV